MSDRAARSAASAQVLALVHDIGKYVARTARNLPAGPCPLVLIDLLAADLYGVPGGVRPAQRYAERAAALAPLLSAAPLALVTALFAEADALEPRLRAGEEAAVRRGAQIALGIERELRGLLALISAEAQ